MKYTTKIALVIAAILITLMGFAVRWAFVEEGRKQTTNTELVAPEASADDTLTTREFTVKLMKRCNAKLSEARTEVLLDQLVRVVHQRFDNTDDRQAFLMLLCIESAFNQEAKSPVGALGIAQLMPQYAQGFAKLCGYGTLDAKDIQDTEVNLHLGACLFKDLLKVTGNTYLAAASYNAGGASASVKNLKDLKAAVPETANYVAKLAILKGENK